MQDGSIPFESAEAAIHARSLPGRRGKPGHRRVPAILNVLVDGTEAGKDLCRVKSSNLTATLDQCIGIGDADRFAFTRKVAPYGGGPSHRLALLGQVACHSGQAGSGRLRSPALKLIDAR